MKCSLFTEILVNNSEFNEFLLSLPFIDGLQLLFSPKNGLMDDPPIAFSLDGSCHTDNFSEESSENDKIIKRYKKYCPGRDLYRKLNGAPVSLKRDEETSINPMTSSVIQLGIDLPGTKDDWLYLTNLHIWFEPSAEMAEQGEIMCPNQIVKIARDGSIKPCVANQNEIFQALISRQKELGRIYLMEMSSVMPMEEASAMVKSQHFVGIKRIFEALLPNTQEPTKLMLEETANSVEQILSKPIALWHQDTMDKCMRLRQEDMCIFKDIAPTVTKDRIRRISLEKIRKASTQKPSNDMDRVFCEATNTEELLDKKINQITNAKDEQNFDSSKFGFGHHDEKYRTKLQEIINRKIDCFSKHEHDFGQAKIENEEGQMELMLCPINFKPGALKDFQAKYRPVPQHFMKTVVNMVSDLNIYKVIERAKTSQGIHQMIFVKKKNFDMTKETSDGKEFVNGQLLSDEQQLRFYGCFNVRVVINLIFLNRSTTPLRALLTPIKYMFQNMAGCKVVSILDQKKAYWSLTVAPKDRKFMCFAVNNQIWQYSRLPMGWVNSSTFLAQFYESCFKGLEFVSWYSDNLVVSSRTEEEHLVHLEMMFERVQKANVKLALDRCHLMCIDSVELFGFQYSIKDGNLRPAVAPKEKLQVFETPTDRKTLKSFLGQVLYYSHIAEALGEDLAELYPLTSQNKEFKWDENHSKAFQAIRDTVTSTTGIYLVNAEGSENENLHLHCDAGPVSAGGKLTLVSTTDGVVRPLFYYHSCIPASRQSRPQYYKELLAMSDMLYKVHYFVAGKLFYLHSDCRPLMFAHRYSHVCDQVCTALEFLNSHQYIIIWESAESIAMKTVDKLSRLHNHSGGKPTHLRNEDIVLPNFEGHPLFKGRLGGKIPAEEFNH